MSNKCLAQQALKCHDLEKTTADRLEDQIARLEDRLDSKDYTEVFTMHEVTLLTGISKQTLYLWRAAKKFPSFWSLGEGRWFLKKASVEKIISEVVKSPRDRWRD